jgi:hypothetical protein
MYKGKVFFGLSITILVFTIINIGVAPCINGKLKEWGSLNCGKPYNEYKKAKDNGAKGDELNYVHKWPYVYCTRRNAMNDLEYDSIVFNFVIGFICGILGLFHLFEVKKEYVSKTGLIGLIGGIIVLPQTLAYVVVNGLVFAHSHPISNYDGYEQVYKTNVDGAFAELKDDKFKCLYFDNEYNYHALYAKFHDLILLRYNYNKKLEEKYEKDEVKNCIGNPVECMYDGYIDKSPANNNCKYLYLKRAGQNWADELKNRDISNRIVTSLIFSCFLCLADLLLAIFGLLLFRTPNEF